MNSRGMTLIEVLISITLLVVMMSQIAIATQLNTKGRRQSERQLDAYHSVRVAMQRMQDDLAQAILIKPKRNAFGRDESPFPTAFIGDGERVDFTTLSGQRHRVNVPHSDQREVGYRNEDETLMRREDYIIDAEVQEGGREFPLVTDIEKMSFAYWDPKRGDWESEWDSTTRVRKDQLPRAVKISMTVRVKGREKRLEFESITLLGLSAGPVAVSQ